MAGMLQNSIKQQSLQVKPEPPEEPMPQALFGKEQHIPGQKGLGQTGDQQGLNTDSPPGMPTPPNVQHPPPPATWQSDDPSSFSPDANEPVPMSEGTGILQVAGSQQGVSERPPMHIHMPLSPFKSFAPPGSGAEAVGMGQHPQVGLPWFSDGGKMLLMCLYVASRPEVAKHYGSRQHMTDWLGLAPTGMSEKFDSC